MRLTEAEGWKTIKPQANTRKLPPDAKGLVREMTLRLAYFVFCYKIPPQLVVNADHTRIVSNQCKGSTRTTKAMLAAVENDVQWHGGVRKFTLLASTSVAGNVLKYQLVMEGKTEMSGPKIPGTKYRRTIWGPNSKQLAKAAKSQDSVCFALSGVQELDGIASLCVMHSESLVR